MSHILICEICVISGKKRLYKLTFPTRKRTHSQQDHTMFKTRNIRRTKTPLYINNLESDTLDLRHLNFLQSKKHL